MAGNALLHVHDLLDHLRITPAMTVVEASMDGSGHVLFPLAQRVGQRGQVVAVRWHPSVVSALEGQRRQALAHHVQVRWGDPEVAGGTPLPDAAADRVVVVGSLWVIDDVEALARELLRLLRPGGMIGVVDWDPEATHPVAPVVALRRHPDTVEQAFDAAGCHRCGAFRPSRWHWGRLFERD